MEVPPSLSPMVRETSVDPNCGGLNVWRETYSNLSSCPGQSWHLPWGKVRHNKGKWQEMTQELSRCVDGSFKAMHKQADWIQHPSVNTAVMTLWTCWIKSPKLMTCELTHSQWETSDDTTITTIDYGRLWMTWYHHGLLQLGLNSLCRDYLRFEKSMLHPKVWDFSMDIY